MFLCHKEVNVSRRLDEYHHLVVIYLMASRDSLIREVFAPRMMMRSSLSVESARLHLYLAHNAL